VREIARLLLPAVRWDPALGFGPARPAMERALAAGVGGFVLEGGDPDAITALASDIRRRADEVPIIAVAPASLAARALGALAFPLPPAAGLTSLRDLLALRRAAGATARELRRLGCNAMLAPSCELAAAPRTDAFDSDPSRVAGLVAEWIDAAQAEGVLCFAGGFPGVGATTGDAAGPPVVRATDDALYSADLVPFRAAIDAGVAAVMVAAAAYPSLDADAVAAPLSRTILGRILRGQLAFDGLVAVDSAALDARAGRLVPASDVVAAGADLVLRPAHLDAALRTMMDAVHDGRLDRERVHDAARRRRERAELASAPSGSAAPHAADRAWLDDVGERVITVLRGRAVRIAPPVDVAIVSGAPAGHATGDAAAAEYLRALAAGVADAGGDGGSVRHALQPTPGARTAFVAIAVPEGDGTGHDRVTLGRAAERLAVVCAEAHRCGRDVAVIWCGHPATAPAVPGADLVVASWCASGAMLRAAGRWLVRRV
jgi:beta-glucosidase-like glycosyl hydrolase